MRTALLIGLVNQLGVEARVLPDAVRLPVTVGLLGGFTGRYLVS